MGDYTIYHNPRCSKSRATLTLLHEHGIEPKVHLYLQDPLDEKTIGQLLHQLGMKAAELVRRGEADFKALSLSDSDDEPVWIEAMAAHPKLIERPIVVRGDRAVVGRPPENVLALID